MIRNSKANQLLSQAKGSHSSTYLTLMSIVQGVTFSFLIFYIISYFERFDFYCRLFSFIALVIISLTWNEYVMGVITFVWIPDLIDAFIPFLLGACEIFIIRSICETKLRFISLSVFSFISLIAFSNMCFKAKKEKGNIEIYNTLKNHIKFSWIILICASVLYLIFWLFLVIFEECSYLPDIFIWIAILIIVVYVIRTFAYWNAFIRYACNK